MPEDEHRIARYRQPYVLKLATYSGCNTHLCLLQRGQKETVCVRHPVQLSLQLIMHVRHVHSLLNHTIQIATARSLYLQDDWHCYIHVICEGWSRSSKNLSPTMAIDNECETDHKSWCRIIQNNDHSTGDAIQRLLSYLKEA